MNLSNRLANTLASGYQVIEKAGWRRGYAADCKSAPQIPAAACFSSEIREIPNLKNTRTNPKHNGNVSNRMEAT